MPQMKTILAVAVGNPSNDSVFNTANPDLSSVRPYIRGLIEWLDLAPAAKVRPETDASFERLVLGQDYEIDYREREARVIREAFNDGGENADVLLCMSTYVAEQALAWRQSEQLETPIVVITSDPTPFETQKQVCGVSALRPQLATIGLGKFKKAQTNLKKIWLLNRQNYGPSEKARKGLGSNKPPLKLENVKDQVDPADVVAQIRSDVPANEIHGLFVLPADRFFGAAKEIQAAADAAGAANSALKTFWSTTDWPTNSFGGYGYPQRFCGRYMAERIASIWASDLNKVPEPAFITVDPSEIDLKPKPAAKKRSKGSSRKKR
jgi:hypothetical protein